LTGAADAYFINAGTPMVAAVTPAVAAAVFKNLRRETFSSHFFSSTFLLIPYLLVIKELRKKMTYPLSREPTSFQMRFD
jgi:hypothetical protein